MSTRTPSQRSAHAHMLARRRRLKALGQWQPYAAAEPVREHLRKVNAAGMSFRAISERLGLPYDSSLQHLMWGRGKWGPGEKVKRETAELVLSYWPSLDDFPEHALIDATGSHRRVQALAVRGWSRNSLALHIGMRRDNFREAIKQERVTARLARRVAAAYDELWDQDPLEHGSSLNSVSRTRGAAQRAGWHGPLAWDDDTIDDPNATPVTDAVAPAVTEGDDVVARWLMGEAVVLGATHRDEALAYLFEWTSLPAEEIAGRLGMTKSGAERVWYRLREKARAEGRREPWRRRYDPRERMMTRNEMEKVA